MRTRADKFWLGPKAISIAPAIAAKPTRDRVQIAPCLSHNDEIHSAFEAAMSEHFPRIHGDIKNPFAVDVSSAVMVKARIEELSK